MAMTVRVCELENGPVEIVSFPISSMVFFHGHVKVWFPEGIPNAMQDITTPLCVPF